ncbi:uncharacterized protein LOC134710375 [Mytilus trossulus]|uniref:uncharacterized protein LOC134710375 n=1 Tax=Mytilus trossulus TaxID=6551 RepID=UPI003006C83B
MADKEVKGDDSSRDLTILPDLTFGFVESSVKSSSKSLGVKEMSKGYKYFAEKYVTNITIHKVDKGGLVRGKCQRSHRKNESAHDVEVVIVEGPILESSTCSCAIGKLGTCGHVTGLLYSLAHMKSCNMKTIPCDILKTSLPQTWHMPRGEKIGGNKADELVVFGYNTQSPQQQPRGLRSTMYNPINSPLPNVSELCQSLSQIDKTCLLLSVIDLESAPVIVNTKFGKFQKGSPVAVQQKLYNHYVLNILDAPEYPSLPVVNFMKNTVCTVLDEKKSLALNSVIVTSEDSIHIEEMTRLQTNEPKWHKIRKDRLTASVAGDIVKRKADNEPLVARLKTTRKVVTESMRHGLSFESVAAAAFVKLHDENVNVYPCGIIVSPYSPWLAASPDRKVYHPSRIPQFGLLEIKCPVKVYQNVCISQAALKIENLNRITIIFTK